MRGDIARWHREIEGGGRAHKALPGEPQALCGQLIGSIWPTIEPKVDDIHGECMLLDLAERGEIRLVRRTATT